MELIEKQAAIDTVVAEGRTVDSKYLESERIIHESDAIEALTMLPSVRPERKKGKWFPIIEANETGEPYQSGVYCSECGSQQVYEPYYCPNCGADMRGRKV